jgi:hypothetical protein
LKARLPIFLLKNDEQTVKQKLYYQFYLPGWLLVWRGIFGGLMGALFFFA